MTKVIVGVPLGLDLGKSYNVVQEVQVQRSDLAATAQVVQINIGVVVVTSLEKARVSNRIWDASERCVHLVVKVLYPPEMGFILLGVLPVGLELKLDVVLALSNRSLVASLVVDGAGKHIALQHGIFHVGLGQPLRNGLKVLPNGINLSLRKLVDHVGTLVLSALVGSRRVEGLGGLVKGKDVGFVGHKACLVLVFGPIASGEARPLVKRQTLGWLLGGHPPLKGLLEFPVQHLRFRLLFLIEIASLHVQLKLTGCLVLDLELTNGPPLRFGGILHGQLKVIVECVAECLLANVLPIEMQKRRDDTHGGIGQGGKVVLGHDTKVATPAPRVGPKQVSFVRIGRILAHV